MKEQYIKMRNSNQLDMSLLYTYAREQGLNLPPDQFSIAMQFASPSEIIEYLDHKFELTLLYGKDGNFIKVVE
jgi:hypothetical protein